MVAYSASFPALMAALVAQVNAHGYMSDPAVTFLSTAGDPTQYIATIESSASGFSGTFNSDPATNTASFTTAFASSKYSSLKEFVTDLGQLISTSGVTITCGLTDPDETPQPLPDTYVEWAHSSSEGFTASHEGPCEIWCDSTRVFQDDDCAAHYTSAPAQLAYDRASCVGASQLTFYWLALHSSQWQVYINCAALDGSTSSTGTTSSGTTSSGTTSSTTTNSTASTSTTSGTSTTSTYTPSTTTSTTTSAPSTSTTDSSSTSTSTSTSTTTTAPSSDSTSSASTSTWSTPSTTPATATSSGTASSGQTSTSSGATGTTWGWGGAKSESGSSNTGGMWPSGTSFGFWG